MGTARTDEHGRFSLEDLSTSHQFHFTVRIGETRNPPGTAAGRDNRSERCFHQRLLMFKPCKEAS
jgi:hypothetical protein